MPVAHLNGVQGVEGSNPFAPTEKRDSKWLSLLRLGQIIGQFGLPALWLINPRTVIECLRQAGDR
jgi:hypothetical protein